MSHSNGGYFIDEIVSWLEAWGYRFVDVPTLVPTSMFTTCTVGTENRIFNVNNTTCLIPEVTNYILSLGEQRLGTDKIAYVARCFRDETTTDTERLCEFTQIGVEYLGSNTLDCRKVVRADAIKLFKKFLPPNSWKLEDGVKRGLNLYDIPDKTFEITSIATRKQILGGGTYKGGAGWALGLERFQLSFESN